MYITVHQYVAIHTLSRDKHSHLSMPIICVQGSMHSSKGILKYCVNSFWRLKILELLQPTIYHYKNKSTNNCGTRYNLQVRIMVIVH
jgi:hypothetical protein